MRLPPSSTAWRIAACSRDGESSIDGNARSRQASTRARQRVARVSKPAGSGIGWIAAGRREGLGARRIVGIAEQAHAQFRLFQRGLAATVEANAALLGCE